MKQSPLPEKTGVELALPAHLMVLMMEECQKAGVEGRDDFIHKLNLAAAGPLAGRDALAITRMARRVDETAVALLNDLAPADPMRGLHSCAMFALLLAKEGLIADPRCQAVLVSLLLIEDTKADHPNEPAVARIEEERWQKDAHRLLSRARILGLYLK